MAVITSSIASAERWWLRAAMKFLGLDPHSGEELQQFLQDARVALQGTSPPSVRLPGRRTAFGPLSTVRTQLGRARRWNELTEVARSEGDLLTAAAYQLRNQRLLGGDLSHGLPLLCQTLIDLGFPKEAQAAQALYTPSTPAEREAKCGELLRQSVETHRNNPLPQGDLRAWRPVDRPRVSLIVSLYNAESKLSKFLCDVARQTLAVRGELELILIDSASPSAERVVAERGVAELGLSCVYFRTKHREPIALAWNRGLALARADYVAFWGVDEGGPDTALQELADYLDQHANVDWIQSDGRVWDVDAAGRPLQSIRTYSRAGFCRELIYLSHQYLTYVGSLYRRQIHERCGFFDPSFRAAGDTEFKYRALPRIQVAAVASELGYYWNYPEERLTEHPRAEIEDVRAYQLHHSAAGVRYAFPHASASELWNLFRQALKFRPCSHRYWATDIEFAAEVGQIVKEFCETPMAQRELIELLNGMLKLCRDADRPGAGWWQLLRTVHAAYRTQLHFRRATTDHFQPACWYFNDARFNRYYLPWTARRTQECADPPRFVMDFDVPVV